MSLDHEEYVERVLQCVETIPRGRVSTYGAIAEVVGALLGGGGPRLVGSTMAQHGGAVTWWRVVRADGSGTTFQFKNYLATESTVGMPCKLTGLEEPAEKEVKETTLWANMKSNTATLAGVKDHLPTLAQRWDQLYLAATGGQPS